MLPSWRGDFVSANFVCIQSLTANRACQTVGVNQKSLGGFDKMLQETERRHVTQLALSCRCIGNWRDVKRRMLITPVMWVIYQESWQSLQVMMLVS